MSRAISSTQSASSTRPRSASASLSIRFVLLLFPLPPRSFFVVIHLREGTESRACGWRNLSDILITLLFSHILCLDSICFTIPKIAIVQKSTGMEIGREWGGAATVKCCVCFILATNGARAVLLCAQCTHMENKYREERGGWRRKRVNELVHVWKSIPDEGSKLIGVRNFCVYGLRPLTADLPPSNVDWNIRKWGRINLVCHLSCWAREKECFFYVVVTVVKHLFMLLSFDTTLVNEV